jgi:hypothetical protein
LTTRKKSSQELIVDEFTSQYLPGEVPSEWNDFAMNHLIPEMAHRSANRLKFYAGEENVQELISLLEKAKSEPESELMEEICGINMIDWREDPDYWKAFEKLIKLIIKNLKFNK